MDDDRSGREGQDAAADMPAWGEWDDEAPNVLLVDGLADQDPDAIPGMDATSGHRVYGLTPQASSKQGRRHRRGPVVAVVAIVAVALATVGFGLAFGVIPIPSQVAGDSDATTPAEVTAEQQEDTASADAGTATDSTATTSDATAILGMLSGLRHVGEDVSLPTDGSEVDVLGGRVLVAYRTADNADVAISRMAASAAALVEALDGSQLTDSSTASDGVSQVPAASTPGGIASGGNGTTCQGVEVVAMSSSGYVMAVVVLPMGDDLSDADEAAILSAADSYAINSGSYRYSGLAAQGVAPSKGGAPTLLTGEEIRIDTSTSRQTSTAAATDSSSTAGTSATSSTTSTTSTRGYGTSYTATTGSTGSYGGTGTSTYGGGDDADADASSATGGNYSGYDSDSSLTGYDASADTDGSETGYDASTSVGDTSGDAGQSSDASTTGGDTADE